MSSSYIIRTYRPADRAALRDIAFDTGLEGASIAPQYADKESFADMFTAAYTDHEPENVLVVERDGQVQGYTCAARFTDKMRSPIWYVLKHCLLRLVWLRPGTARFYLRALLDSVRDLTGVKRPYVDPAVYPSHVHINLGPNARGAGVAIDILTQLFERMIAQGSNGIYAECLASNKAIAAVAKKFGFIRLGGPYPAPGIRSSDGGRVKIQIFAMDLHDWERRKRAAESGEAQAERAPAQRAAS